MKIELLGNANKEFVEEQIKIVATAGSLSRFNGNVFEALDARSDYEKNIRFIKRVIGMGHESITDHDYLVFAIQDVTPVVEQTIIEERLSSFTIKSRREVDFSKVGYYIPEFKNKNGEVLENQDELKMMYVNHMDKLFDAYQKLVDLGIKKEDARFVLPYSYHSNIIMGMDAHCVKNMIVRFTKGKESQIAELKEFGEKLYEIVKVRCPYLVDLIEKTKPGVPLENFIYQEFGKPSNKNLEMNEVKLLNYTPYVDDRIVISSLMRIYQLDEVSAADLFFGKLATNPEYYEAHMRALVNDPELLDLTQVNFQFQIPVSLATLTHLTRHRGIDILTPSFPDCHNLLYYVTPRSMSFDVNPEAYNIYQEMLAINNDACKKMIDEGVREEDLVYYNLSGNKVNVLANIDGKNLRWILRLRRCNKAQWEVRHIADEMQELVEEVAPEFAKILGPDCEVFGECYEGKESCGKVKALINRKKEN